MKQNVSDEEVLKYLDFLIRMRPFEGTSTIDGKTEFILFWALHARIPISDFLIDCYWISARHIPKELMEGFIEVLKSNPKHFDPQTYPEWSYYKKDMASSHIHKAYNEMLEKGVFIKNMYNQIQRIVDFTIDYLNERLGYVIDEKNILRYFQLYFESELFRNTIHEIRVKSKEKKGKIEKKKDRKF